MNKNIILLLILTLLPSVTADFLAYGTPTINATICEQTTTNLTIQSIGTADYTITIDGTAANFATFSATNFKLENQTGIITTYYTIPCDTKPGEYSLEIYFSDQQQEKYIQQTINVTEKPIIRVKAIPEQINITPCDTAITTLSLSNPTQEEKTYKLTITGHETARLTQDEISISPGEVRTTTIRTAPEDCTETGTIPLTLTISDGQKTQTEKIQVNIRNSDIPEIATGIKTIRTEYEPSAADIPITNKGDRTTTYQLKVQGPNWVTITPTITLNSGETKNAQITTTPTQEITTGNYEITISAIVQETEIEYSKKLTIKLGPPTFYEKNPALAIAITVALIVLITTTVFLARYVRSSKFKRKYEKWQQKRAELKKEKAKRKEEQRKLKQKQLQQKLQEIQKKKEEQIKQKEINHQAQLKLNEKLKEQEQKKARRQYEKQFKKNYLLIPKQDIITAKTTKPYKSAILILFLILVTTTIIAGWDYIMPNWPSAATGAGLLLVFMIINKLKNINTKTYKHKITTPEQEYHHEAWKKGLTHITLTTQQTIQKLVLKIKKQKLTTPPSKLVASAVTIQTNTETQIKLHSTFTVKKNWLKRNNLQPEDIKIAQRTKGKWTTIPAEKTGETDKYIHYTTTIQQGTYAVYAKYTPTKSSDGYKKTIAITLITIAALTGIMTYMTPETTKGIPAQNWQQNTIHTINLNQYFDDPDEDTLQYSATKTDTITTDIIDGIAYLTPQTDWIGETTIQFTASDKKGGSVQSNTVKLTVKPYIIPPTLHPYIALVLGILIILILVRTVKKIK